MFCLIDCSFFHITHSAMHPITHPPIHRSISSLTHTIHPPTYPSVLSFVSLTIPSVLSSVHPSPVHPFTHPSIYLSFLPSFLSSVRPSFRFRPFICSPNHQYIYPLLPFVPFIPPSVLLSFSCKTIALNLFIFPITESPRT